MDNDWQISLSLDSVNYIILILAEYSVSTTIYISSAKKDGNVKGY